MRDDRIPNLLISERSPYLQQHAYNPVMWRPWTDAAFALARAEDKPVFVSIGYATCHWCHVMEHESFEDAEVARILNEWFISVKVDREERPDVDAIYMDVCQAMTGHGGWPLTVIMDADQRPFFTGTYFPKHSRNGRLGLIELLTRIHEVWTTDRDRVDASATEITDAVRKQAAMDGRGTIPDSIVDATVDHHVRMFDDVHGGFGTQPKFPSPHHLLFLLRAARHRTPAERSSILNMVTTTLDAMRSGGLYDHVGFGFHRYATDSAWLVPHFEKMLYDQAMLMLAYTEAYQCVRDETYARVVDEIATYVGRCLTQTNSAEPETFGAFTSAQDADSEGEEGKYYVWTHDELLAHGCSEALAATLGVHVDGNFNDEASGSATGTNILHCSRDMLRALMVDPAWVRLRADLLATRERRIPPITDTKVLTDWNGLMIVALATAARVFDDERYLGMARSAYEVIRRSTSHVCGAHTHVPLLLDDMAARAWAAFELYQTTGDSSYRGDAERDVDVILRDYHDDVHGGLFQVSATHAGSLLVRQKHSYDGAYPSGASMAAYVMAGLDRPNDVIEASAAYLAAHAPGHCMMLCAWDRLRRPPVTITIAGDAEHAFVRSAKRAIHSAFLPSVTVHGASSENPHVVICEGTVCSMPITDLDEVLARLEELA